MSTTPDDINRRIAEAFGKQSHSGDMASERDFSDFSSRRPRAFSPRALASLTLSGAALVTAAAVVVAGSGLVGPRQPLFTMASGAASGVATSESMSSDIRMMPWVSYKYLPSEELSRDAGRGKVYQLVLDGDPMETLSAIARAVGVEGEPRESDYFDPSYPGYVIGDESGLGELVSLWWSGSGTWYYSNPEAYPQPVCREIVEGDTVTTECDEPAPPAAPLPDPEKAREDAAQLFSSTGLDVEASDVEVSWVDQWSVNLTAVLSIDGQPTALEWYVSYGPGGEIAYASGNMAQPVERGEFGTVSPYDAVARLNEGIWWGSAAASFFADLPVAAMAREADESSVSAEDAGTGEPAVDEPTTEEPATDQQAEGDVSPELPAEEGTEGQAIEPSEPEEPVVPIEPAYPEQPEVVDVTVASAQSALVLVFDAEGGWWIVPGYVLSGSEGWPSAVVALEEGVIEVPEPVGVPMPLID